MPTSREPVSATEAAVNYLRYRLRTEMEVRRRLAEKDYAPNEIEEAVAAVKSYGYVDDARYCREYFRAAADRGKSRRRIEAELGTKGVARETVENAIDDLLEQDEEPLLSERERACQVAGKMLRQQREDGKAVDRKFCARVCRRLAGLGYSADIIYGIVDRIETTEKQELEDEQSI